MDELLAAQGGGGAPKCDELLGAVRAGEAVLWLATIGRSQAGEAEEVEEVEEILGVGAVQLTEAERAAIRCLAVRQGAPTNVGERLREACEASASGRDFEWLSLTVSSAPGVTAEQCKSAGYRYYRRDAHGSDVLIKRLRS